jgi:hypothetical protein
VVKLYVEGGGDSAVLRTACREGFTRFITRAGIAKRPRVVACGSRRDAYESFCMAIANGEAAMLLVDSEVPVAPEHQQPKDQPAQWQPWQHLKARVGDGWDKPANALDTDCHLMVQVMESWFLVDRETLRTFFGQGFRENALPAANRPIEGVAKDDVYRALKQATGDCKTKAEYGKGEHSFKLLVSIDPAKVIAASPWARRFVDELKKKIDV